MVLNQWLIKKSKWRWAFRAWITYFWKGRYDGLACLICTKVIKSYV